MTGGHAAIPRVDDFAKLLRVRNTPALSLSNRIAVARHVQSDIQSVEG